MRSRSPRTLQLVLLTFFILGLITLALSGYMAPLTRIVFAPVLGAQTWLSTRVQALRNLVSQPQDLASLREENARQASEIAKLQAEIIDLRQQLSETEVLSALVDFARAHPENSYTAAAVIGRDPSAYTHYIIINRGSDAGVHYGMPVVTSKGLVGRVTAVTAGAARVQTITDPDSAVNVRIEPSAPQAVVNGSLSGSLNLDMIPQSAEVKQGDLILTSGLGGNYPANILIGQVISSRRKETDMFQVGTVQAVVDFSRLDIVLVITNFQPVDIQPLLPTSIAPAGGNP